MIQDEPTWGNSANQDVLDFLGVTYDEIGSAALATTDLTQYRAVIYSSSQPRSYYQNINDSISQIEAYVAQGGTLVAHCCDQPGGPDAWFGLDILPESITHVESYDESLTVAAVDHPSVMGAPSTDPDYLDGWGASTHGYFTDLPAEYLEVIYSDFGPTYIDYVYGEGRVLATMQTIEYGYAFAPELLRSELRGVLIDTVAPATTIAGLPTGASTDEVTFTLSAEDGSGSGVADAYYRLNGGADTPYTAEVVVEAEGTTTIEYWSVDNAENIEDVNSVDVEIVAEALVPIEGVDRYQTAIEISQANWEAAETVVIATGNNWPDALGGSALAGAVGGPVLMSRLDAVPDEVLAEVDRLGASQAYVLGGERALTADVLAQLESALGETNVIRIGGADRYETAELVADEVVSILGDSYDGTAFIATGGDFADALAASPMAAANGWPVYLARKPVISDQTLDAMVNAGVTDAILLGGDAAMPEGTVVTVLAAGISAKRIDGENRYETAAKVAEYGVTDAGLAWEGVAIATGEDFPDALAGGPAQALVGAGMLLSPSDQLSGYTADKLSEHKYDISSVAFFGGIKSLSADVREAVATALN
ncbi:MAG: cell wall-binding repeat-containing protein [Coriobacteriia bacterium]|nr:cell wall-binding repeat-containing protein [Coriobacteriia bacterium]